MVLNCQYRAPNWLSCRLAKTSVAQGALCTCLMYTVSLGYAVLCHRLPLFVKCIGENNDLVRVKKKGGLNSCFMLGIGLAVNWGFNLY